MRWAIRAFAVGILAGDTLGAERGGMVGSTMVTLGGGLLGSTLGERAGGLVGRGSGGTRGGGGWHRGGLWRWARATLGDGGRSGGCAVESFHCENKSWRYLKEFIWEWKVASGTTLMAQARKMILRGDI